MLKKKLKKIILLFGPTASGKSKIAIEIANKFNGEIINADSMQIYKEIKILSARPDAKNPKHHLYGFVTAKKNFSVGLWHKLAIKKINQIRKKGKTPIVTGGTGLYFKVLLEGLSKIPEVPKIKLDLDLINYYKKTNPKIFSGIALNDTQRLLRAISVYKYTGIPIKKWYEKANKKKSFKSNAFIKIFLNPPKTELESKIRIRFDKMLKDGALDECKRFKKLNVNKLNSSHFIIGLKEIAEYLNKEISKNELIERVIIRSRQYAKRQFTWQRGQMRDWKGFADTKYLDLRKKILSYLSKT